MRNLSRGYRRVALVVGLLIGPPLTWFMLNQRDPSTGMSAMQQHQGDWAVWVALGIFALIATLVIAVTTWLILWAVTGLGIWVRRGFQKET